ncbi:Sterile alpha and TIR motif-containing protein 1 [Hypsibius exemplaris]|uniref:ADP-ribosyl cyclase/cyclic ADP-ribose hydrolase n=1 Tax=Hypsibius exemplaris TaxID=2072580 RepID=A0A1W0XD19_HYPEX|nr:Sterile alpha and TIR motif-containing protein 1 [Hypsibius exemplaris]
MLKSLKNAMDHRHKKKPGNEPPSPSPSAGAGSSSASATAASNGPPAFVIAPKVFDRRASAESTLNPPASSIYFAGGKGLPPKMSKSPEPQPVVTEPDSPMPVIRSRYGSQDGLLNGRSQTGSPLVERSSHSQSHHHQTSTQSVTVQQRRTVQEIVDGPNGRQVLSYSADRQNSQSKESQITSTEVNGEVKVDADHKVSSSSAGKASLEALDSMGQSLRAACAALSHSSNTTSSSFAGTSSGVGELTQTSRSETAGFQGMQNPDGTFRGATYHSKSKADGVPTVSQGVSTAAVLDQMRSDKTMASMENQVRNTLRQMAEMMDGANGTMSPMLKNKMADDGVVDLLIDNVDSSDQEVSVLSAKVLDRCMNPEAREKLLKKGVDGIVRVATIKGNAESRRVGTGLLEKMLNNSETACSEVVKHGGLDAVLEACKSQDLQTQRSSALALLNLSLYGGQFNQHQMIKQRAQDWLFPLAFGQTDPSTKYFACLCVGSLIANKELEAAVVKSGTLDLVNEFVTDNSPEIFATVYAEQLDPKQSRDVMTRLIPSLESKIAEAQQLAAFHFATEAHARQKKNDLKIFKELGIIEHLKTCASSPNDIASRLAGMALKVLGETVPHRLSQQSPLWTLQDVKHWLQQVGFPTFAKPFAESEVDGDLLLQLTDVTLQEDLKMNSRLQRQRFIRDLHQLKRISDYTSCDPYNIHSFLLGIAPEYAQYTYNLLKSGIDPSVFPFITDDHLKNDAHIENGVHRAKILDAIRKRHSLERGVVMDVRSETDVFISYRRATGSQLASLLKVHLQLRGFSVFIDIDKLDAGAFDQKLIDSVRMAKHFVLVLSPTALDRCIGDDERKDWIHREISAALACKCNIVPVTDPTFCWPSPEVLPEDMRSIGRFNGIRWIHDYQDACVDKLERFLRGDLNIKTLSAASTAAQSSAPQSGAGLSNSSIAYHGSAF